MEFCSKYGYDYGFKGSDDESIEDEDQVTKQKVTKKIRKADTNIIAVKFDRLVMTNEMFAGDYKQCKNCNAIMTAHSKKSIKSEDGKRIWTCEFCEETNDISSLVSENMQELPRDDDVTFLIEAPPAKQEEKKSDESNEQKASESNYLTLCIDISGSMDEMIQIKKEKETKNDNGEPTYEYVRTQTTRLDGVKMACIETTKSLKENDPNKLVSMVTFSNDVKFFGDCSKSHKAIVDTSQSRTLQSSNQSLEIAPDILDNKEKMIALAKNQDGNIMPISKSYQNMESKLKFLRTEGSTALGPGLVFAVGFSAKKPGSQVILCTDGCANVGMGSVEYSNIAESEKFYNDVADYAKENGVSVNVISMEGTDCKLSLLGKLADRSNGTLSVVNPLNLGDEFKSILENRIVATNVKAKLIVNHKYLYVRDEELEAAEGKAIDANDMKAKEELNQKKKSFQEKDIGNALYDSEITFEYGLRKLKSAESAPKELKEMPFQLQISYTTLDGSKAIRVYTKLQEFTKDRRKAESNMISQDIVFSNAAQKMSHFTIESSVCTAQYRSRGIEILARQNNLAAPKAYTKKANMVMNFRKSQRYDEMDDEAAEEMYSGKKMNRFFKK